MSHSNSTYDKYKENGEITWAEFDSNQRKNQGKVVLVQNSDFIYGTLRVMYPCAIKFMQNIVFNPDNGNGSNPWYEPSKSVKKNRYKGHGYILGFFAALALESNQIIVDMNQMSIEMSPRFFILQRFYNHIELGNAPFVMGQGPGNFGPLISANYCCTFNGTMGLTSHAGVHGNNNIQINILNLVIHDFEVNGIALNGASYPRIKNVVIRDQIDYLPVLGIFSAAVFMRNFLSYVIPYTTLPQAKADLTFQRDTIQTALQDSVKDILKNGTIGSIDPTRVSTRIFINEQRLPDGSVSYGIVLNKLGVAINGFSPQRPQTFNAHDATIDQVVIKNLKGNPIEIVGLSQGKKDMQKDSSGSVLHILKVANKAGFYVPNVVSEAQFSLARWSDKHLTGADPVLVELRKKGRLGPINFHPAIVAWARPDVMYKGINNTIPLSAVMSKFNIKYICNEDTMIHVQKGIIGIRIDSVKTVNITRTIIENVSNVGKAGSDICGAYTKSHPLQFNMIGYGGTITYGVVASASDKITMTDSKISNLYSKYGSVHGFDYNNYSQNLYMKNNTIEKLLSDAPIYTKLPNTVPVVAGVVVDKTSVLNKIVDTDVVDIQFSNAFYLPVKYHIDNNNTEITRTMVIV